MLLRYPEGENITLHVPLLNGTYSVYLRKNNTCNPLLYDTAYLSVNNSQLPLPGYCKGVLLGIFIDFHGNTINGKVNFNNNNNNICHRPYEIYTGQISLAPYVNPPIKMNVPHNTAPQSLTSQSQGLLPKWAIALIVISSAAVFGVPFAYFLHKRGFISPAWINKILRGKTTLNQNEYKHLGGMEGDVALDFGIDDTNTIGVPLDSDDEADHQ